MFLESVTIDTENDLSDENIAMKMWRFWEWQVRKKEVEYRAAESRPDSMMRANEQARREYDDDGSFGWGPAYPYSQEDIKKANEAIEPARLKYEEVRAYREFFVKQFIRRGLA